jgi:hypothetical protein
MNVFNIQTNRDIIKIITTIFLMIITNISCATEEEMEIYNFVDKQNFEIDLNYNQIMGTDLYFFSADNMSFFFVNIFPELNLSIDMKLYTNNTDLIHVIENNDSLFFGLNFNITNLDPEFANLRSDIFLCNFNKNETVCSDYAYDLKQNKYLKNLNGALVKSKYLHIY